MKKVYEKNGDYFYVKEEEFEKMKADAIIKCYYGDSRANKWDASKYTEEEAEELSKTLRSCYYCIDCMDCDGCVDCTDCTDCEGCVDCTDCTDCCETSTKNKKIIIKTLKKGIVELKKLEVAGIVKNPCLKDLAAPQRLAVYDLFKRQGKTDGDSDGAYNFINEDNTNIGITAFFAGGYAEDTPEKFWIDTPNDQIDGTISELETILTQLNEPPKFINLTPHPINIIGSDDVVKMSIPSSGSCRVNQTTNKIDNIAGIDILQTSYTDVDGLPDAVANTFYIVSLLVLQALDGDRPDCLAPNTSPTPQGVVRGEDGQILGVRSFVTV